MTGLLLGRGFARAYRERLAAVERETGARFEPVLLPDDPAARVAPDALAKIELAFFSHDVFPDFSPAFFSAALNAPGLRWLHLFNAGTDHPIFAQFLERGIALTNSPGGNAVPIAQSAITGLLMLARRFPAFAEAQRRRAWRTPEVEPPPDLGDQTLVVLGLGAIGCEIARLGRALGLHVIGVRRSPRRGDDPVDELVTPAELHGVLPRADWLAIACPLTDETRRVIDAAALDLLPEGAGLVNIARGEILDEAAATERLASGRLGGAYLDVFEVEPLPESSPLWSLPNVIVTPHAASISAGGPARQAEIFLANLTRWARKEPLENQVS